MTQYNSDIEKTISRVMRDRELSRAAAIAAMLAIATGRLNALHRYDKSVPKGKETKGILQIVGRKKVAPKTAKISNPLAKRKPKRKAQVVEAADAAE